MSEIDTLPRPGPTSAEDSANNARRRLEDKILVVFHQAYEQKDEEVATRLLEVLEFIWMRDRDNPGRRRNLNYLVAALERCRRLARAIASRG